ncbi:glycine receptor subunit alpha-2-like isoform X2 [Panulirus ornatus]|uniref:glycine receptor subunit alpha-2-like isoform X2 n=1 Tax=Panulirus ornatus TaxID=150431 RepID=UPI003A868854
MAVSYYESGPSSNTERRIDVYLHIRKLRKLIWFVVYTGGCLMGGAWGQPTDTVIPGDYLKHIRPSPPDGGPVMVGVGWHLSRVHGVNVNDMTIVMTVRVSMAWREPRFNYGESQADDHQHLLPLDLAFLQRIWKPDLFFLDIQDLKRFSMVKEVAGLWIMENRTLYFSFLAKVTLDCPMNFNAYPFDVQTCRMIMTSYEYHTEEMVLYWLGQGVTYSHRINALLPGYELEVLSDNLTVHHWCSNCLLEPTSAASTRFLLERKYGAHILTVYLPSAFFVAVAWLSFFWPPEPMPARTVLVITSLLTLVSAYSVDRQSSPKTDYVKAIDVWFFFCICLNVLVLFELAVVVTLRRQQHSLQLTQTIKGTTTVISGAATERIQDMTRLSQLQRREAVIELTSKVVLPSLFLLFNLLYWPIYLSFHELHGLDPEE